MTLFIGANSKSKRFTVQQYKRSSSYKLVMYIQKLHHFCNTSLMMAQSWAERTWEITNYGRFINQFPPNIDRSIRQFERINKKCLDEKCRLCSIKYIYIYILHSLEWAAAGIGLHLNAHKTGYISFNLTGDIFTLNGSSLKLVDKFTYQGISVSSTEIDIDTRLLKAWTANDSVSVIWKSDLTEKMKRRFFQAAVVSIMLYGYTTWTQTKRMEKKLDGNYTRMLRAILNKSLIQQLIKQQFHMDQQR